jgi:hypothetical protein
MLEIEHSFERAEGNGPEIPISPHWGIVDMLFFEAVSSSIIVITVLSILDCIMKGVVEYHDRLLYKL